MKNIKYLMMMAISIFFASCMGDKYAEIDENQPIPYGNNALTETNVMSIAALKESMPLLLQQIIATEKVTKRLLKIFKSRVL